MKVLTRSILIAFALIQISCGSNDVIVPNQYKGEFITFGNGGGFTGSVSKYYVFPNGKVYRNQVNSDTLKYLGEVNSSVTGQQFQNFKALMLDKERINDPGNIYYFLGNQQNNQILTWGGNSQDIPKHITTFYNNLNGLIKNLGQHNQKN